MTDRPTRRGRLTVAENPADADSYAPRPWGAAWHDAMPAEPTATRGDDDRDVAHYWTYAEAADTLAAHLSADHTVTVIGTGGGCPAILVTDGRPEYDVLVVDLDHVTGEAGWCASPDQDVDSVTYGPTATAAYLTLAAAAR